MSGELRTFGFEELEGRLMMSAAPLKAVPETGTLGNELVIWGTEGNDRIEILPSAGGGVTVRTAEGWSEDWNGNFKIIRVLALGGDDFVKVDPRITIATRLYGGDGDDTLIGGGGRDWLRGGAGNDIIVDTPTSCRDVLIGDQGRDEFWLTTTTKKHIADDSSVASMRSRVHHVASFWNKIKQNNPARPRRVNLPDPSLTSKYISYRNFSTRPLFSGEGPTADDVAQGYLGDCYFLATLSSVAGINPSLIRRSIVDLGDGTYGVQFLRGNQKVVVRVDADLPTLSNGQMAYAGFGAENSIWVGIMEKAWAFFRYDDASYASTEGGWMGEVYDAMGQANRSTWYIPANKTLLGMIRNELNAGRSVTFGVGEFSGNIPLISYHAYSVDRVVEDAEGNLSMVLRNPWAIDGAGNDGNDDGYVTINEAQAQAAFLAYSSATVA